MTTRYHFFQEWRHAHGMRCLGIPNTAHFANVTFIEDAVARKSIRVLFAFLFVVGNGLPLIKQKFYLDTFNLNPIASKTLICKN